MVAEYQECPRQMMNYALEKATAVDIMFFLDPGICGDAWREVRQDVARSGGRVRILWPHDLI